MELEEKSSKVVRIKALLVLARDFLSQIIFGHL